MEPLLTTEEVADFLRVDVVTVRRLINKGGLSAYRVGSEFRFARADLEEFLRRQRTSGGEIKMETDRFEKFTERARKVIFLSHEEAVRLNHSYIGTEHLLLGLVREGEGIAAQVLRGLGVELHTVRERVEFIIGHKNPADAGFSSSIKAAAVSLLGQKAHEHGLTPRARKVIELARDEAMRLNHHYIGTEHLLLGLVREGDGIAAGVLENLGVSLALVRTRTLELLDSKTGSPPAAEMMTPPSVPTEAATLVPGDTVAITCATCGASNLPYFHYCFNCGARLSPQRL